MGVIVNYPYENREVGFVTKIKLLLLEQKKRRNKHTNKTKNKKKDIL